MKPCNQCGKCCQKYADGGLSASSSEIEFWEIFKPMVAAYVKGGEIWIDPKTGKQLTHCPWLKESASGGLFSCDIYHDRPDDCRYYPVTIDEMIRDGCEMLEPADIAEPVAAQRKLDIMMQDSRPALES